MKRLIIIFMFLQLLFSCTRSNVVNVEEKLNYFGDSTLTLDFEYYANRDMDTTFINKFKRGELFEISTWGIHGDTGIINMRKDLISGCYNGACEFVRDTLICNYWLDSIDCRPELINTVLVFKFRAKEATDKYNIVFKPTLTPRRKYCN